MFSKHLLASLALIIVGSTYVTQLVYRAANTPC